MPRNRRRVSSSHDQFEQGSPFEFLEFPGPVHCLGGKQCVNKALLAILHLALGEGPKRQNLHASGEGLRDFRQQHDIRRSGEEELSRLAPAVYGGLDYRKEFWDMLDLVECDRKREAGDETIGVASGSG